MMVLLFVCVCVTVQYRRGISVLAVVLFTRGIIHVEI